jgi:hypothetical protein
LPWIDAQEIGEQVKELTEMGSKEQGGGEAAVGRVPRTKRNVKGSKPPPEPAKKRPVGQRWYYEPVEPPKALMAVCNETGESSVGSKGRTKSQKSNLANQMEWIV